MKKSVKRESVSNLSEQEQKDLIEERHRSISKEITDNYDNKNLSPLTIHNSLHSFEKCFTQYSFYLKELPTVYLNYGQINFYWKGLEIVCQGGNFRAKCTIKNSESGFSAWMSRKKLMAVLEAYFSEKFPVPPC